MQTNVHKALSRVIRFVCNTPSQLWDYIFRKRTIHCLNSINYKTTIALSKICVRQFVMIPFSKYMCQICDASTYNHWLTYFAHEISRYCKWVIIIYLSKNYICITSEYISGDLWESQTNTSGSPRLMSVGGPWLLSVELGPVYITGSHYFISVEVLFISLVVIILYQWRSCLYHW